MSEALKRLGPLVQQAELLAAQYDAVVANPPYIGQQVGPTLRFSRNLLKDNFPESYDKDVFCVHSLIVTLRLSKPHGRLGFMSPFVWMFISMPRAFENAAYRRRDHHFADPARILRL